MWQADSFILLTNSANSSSMISSSSLPLSDPRWGAFCDVFMASFFTASTMFCIFKIGWLIDDIFSFLTLIRWCCDVFVFRVLNVSRGEQLDQVGQNFLYNSFLLWLEVLFSYLLIFSLQRPSAKLELEGNFIGGYYDHFQKNSRLWTEIGRNNELRYHTLTREEVYTTSSMMASLDNKEVKICAIVNIISSL